MVKQKNIFFVSLFFLNITLFILALNLENASINRHRLLVLLFLIHLGLFLFRVYRLKKEKYYGLFLLLSLGVISLLEWQSKFVVNYFFHFFYVFVILEGAYALSLKKSTAVSTLALLLSMTKYVYLLSVEFNLRNTIESVFFFLINGLIIVSTAFTKYYVEEKKKTQELYEKLLTTHEQLQEYTIKAKELSIVKERNRIARDLHDTLGHSITGLIMQLELAENYMEQDKEKTKVLINQSKDNARDSLRQVRMAINALKEKEEFGVNSIKSLIKDFIEKTHIHIDFGILGDEKSLSPQIYIVIYRTIQEALTNSIRHGKASRINIKITFSEKNVFLYIEDNGMGCNTIIVGNGLRGMKERVKSVKGELFIRGNSGFRIKVSIPIE
ncbi:signal transduction histidine kinase [Natranaerovirga hydrolytica]|uniref:histidine kinase n=1 Tax=Natranaerovirga hydrolytica TaxID=680378 RepID=A0A4R1M940_9FIRM|nr:sensor histidine kinase [Natranaerovirga hydrolytica]TCK87922.1 signal transduction histidine kinase [Natranaerovirga hydrolytica]